MVMLSWVRVLPSRVNGPYWIVIPETSGSSLGSEFTTRSRLPSPLKSPRANSEYRYGRTVFWPVRPSLEPQSTVGSPSSPPLATSRSVYESPSRSPGSVWTPKANVPWRSPGTPGVARLIIWWRAVPGPEAVPYTTEM